MSDDTDDQTDRTGDGTWREGDRIVRLDLDERTVVRRAPEVEQERAVAIYDLIETNVFRLEGDPGGPYHLHLAIEENRLRFRVHGADGEHRETVAVGLVPFRRIVRDYFTICESYYDAIKRLSPSQIEAIDMGRRGLHNEGATLLRERLEGKVAMDFDTARRLFTLVCVLHFRG